uniref:adenylyl-sulfate kinase n=1 Tax=Nostoc sp. MG11 TaxID=2721166 RepID=UPI00186641CF
RRLGFVAQLLSRNGIIAIIAAISPYREVREQLKKTSANFIEVYVKAPIAVCESRDVKGLYAKARAGQIEHFTGISDPYEEPINPDITCLTDKFTVEQCVGQVLEYLESQGLREDKRSLGRYCNQRRRESVKSSGVGVQE